MSRGEKALSLHRDFSFPRSAIAGVRVVSSGMDEVHGYKLAGAGIPAVMSVGSFKSQDGTTFAVCHHNGPAIVIDLAGQHYDRLVVTLDDPEQVASQLQ